MWNKSFQSEHLTSTGSSGPNDLWKMGNKKTEPCRCPQDTTYGKSKGEKRPKQGLEVSLLEETVRSVGRPRHLRFTKQGQEERVQQRQLTAEDPQRAPGDRLKLSAVSACVRTLPEAAERNTWKTPRQSPKVTLRLEMFTFPLAGLENLVTHKTSGEHSEEHRFTGANGPDERLPWPHWTRVKSNLKRIKINPI